MVQRVLVRRLAAGLGAVAVAAMGLLSACSSKSSDQDKTPSATTPASPTEKSMNQQGPNSFAPTAIGTSPTMGANDNNTVSVPGPPHLPGSPGLPGPPGGGEPGGPGAGPGKR
jgi:hypothetical protein